MKSKLTTKEIMRSLMLGLSIVTVCALEFSMGTIFGKSAGNLLVWALALASLMLAFFFGRLAERHENWLNENE